MVDQQGEEPSKASLGTNAEAVGVGESVVVSDGGKEGGRSCARRWALSGTALGFKLAV